MRSALIGMSAGRVVFDGAAGTLTRTDRRANSTILEANEVMGTAPVCAPEVCRRSRSAL